MVSALLCFIFSMMATTNECFVCNEIIRPRQDRINCGSCASAFHRTCNTGCGQNEYRLMKKGLLPKVPYTCDTCIISITQPIAESTRMSFNMHDLTEPYSNSLSSHHSSHMQDLTQPYYTSMCFTHSTPPQSPVQPPPSLTESSISDPVPMEIPNNFS